ncbi:hypothetical protein PVIIG_05412 [Plasmodium vivax India VII]|uniref:Uncharacterized protein n=1 Tax=Plasmodium vivax India VII TaxID=1077284 RepID=A0A0J9S292_PLAVI|nr:hypothetical protein PVIIG_05412 [Plasmodium vivax India VII]
MSNDIMDIDKWKNDLPFLKDVWKRIDDFDKAVEKDENYNQRLLICDLIIKLSNGDKEKHNDVCMKLLRNLGHHSKDDKFLRHTPERCNNLNNWIYYSMKKHIIPENIITGCFDDYNAFMRGIVTDPRCSYYSYDTDYIEPIKIIKLRNFQDNINIIESTMKNKTEPNYSLCQKYICECVNIYKSMFKAHCSHVIPTNNIKLKKTCDVLKAFNGSYSAFLYNKEQHRNQGQEQL